MEGEKKIRLPARASVFYGAAIILSKAIGILTTPIFTRAMSPEEYGAYSYYISFVGIVSMVSGVFLSPALFYSGLGKFSDNRRGFSDLAVWLSTAANLLICIVLFTFSSFFSLDRRLVPIILLQGFVDNIINAELLRYKFFYGYTRVILINISSALLSSGISVFLVCSLGMGAMGRIFGLVAAGLIISLVITFSRKERGAFEPTQRKFLIKNALPLIPAVIARASVGWADKLIIKAELGVDALAKYSVAHTVGLGLFALIGALCSALNPWLVRKLRANQREATIPVIGELSSVIAWGSLFIVALAPEIFSFLAPKSYMDALYVIPIMALSAAPYFLFNMASVFISYGERTKIISLCATAGAAINLAANLILIPRIGYTGAAISYLLSEVAMYLISHRAIAKWEGREAVARWARGMLLPLIFSAVFALLYGNAAVRIFLLIIPACQVIRSGFICLGLAREK